MDAARPKVSIVIPNRDGLTPRNGLTYLKMVLPSLREQTFRDFDVTVVDDGSSDGSVAYLREEWPEIRVVSLPGNSGFPAVVNRGIEASSGEYIALLNNDLELSADWLEGLVAELDRDPELGFVTGKVVRHGDHGVIEQAGHDYYTCGRFSPRGLDAEDVGQFDQPRDSTIVTAAASLYRREAVDAAGSFDEDYFLYCEDGDLCLRILLQGYRGRYIPGPVAYHVRGGTTGQESDLTRFYLLRNVPTTIVKDLPARVLWRALPQVAAYQLNQVVEARQGGFVRTLFRAYLSMLRWLPRTLVKRRRVQRARRVSASEFEAHLQTDYPLATRFDRLLRYPGARVN